MTRSGIDDAWLIQETLAGNRSAFRFLLLRYQRPVFRFLATFRLPEPVVEEVAQECFLRVYRRIGSYDANKGASFASWIFTIARNLALNELARKQRQIEIDPIDSETALEDDILDPHEHLERAEVSRRVAAAVDRIPDPFRQALVLSYFGELSIQDIARIEGCSSGTVKSRIHRGKKLLKSILGKEAQR